MSQIGQGLEESALSQAIKGADWVIPLLQSIHIVTIGVVFVSSLMIALRVMGRMRADEPFVAVWARFAPWMWYGLVVMVVTGVLLVIGEPVREFTAFSFWLKMTLLAIAVITTFVFGRTFGPGGSGHAGAGAGAGSLPGGGSKVASGAGPAVTSGAGPAVTSGAGPTVTSGAGPTVTSGTGSIAYAGVSTASDAEFSPRAKAIAVTLIVLWLAIIFLGRAIAYDVEIWGGASLHT